MKPMVMMGLLVVGLILCGTLVLLQPDAAWTGIDETVIERVAFLAGRTPTSPLLDTDRGDLPLFFFLGFGVIAGFVVGYLFRELFPPSGKSARRS